MLLNRFSNARFLNILSNFSDSKQNGFPHYLPSSHQTGFGGHRSNSFDLGSGLGPPVNKHRNRLSALGRLFKPWKWKRRKKSEKFEKTSKCKYFLLLICQYYLVLPTFLAKLRLKFEKFNHLSFKPKKNFSNGFRILQNFDVDFSKPIF